MSESPFDDADEGPHGGVAVDEWVFACWEGDGSAGLVSGLRLHHAAHRRPTAWYWAALARSGRPLLHVTEWDVRGRADPLLVKAHGLWADHTCDAPMEQWTVANETYAAALDDPQDALGRAYGMPSAVAFDLEWYATGPPGSWPDGYAQDGVVHGTVELPGGAMSMTEAPARRWHRWGDGLGPLLLPPAFAHRGVRAPFAFPDGTVSDWMLTPDGWRAHQTNPP